jgi:hypothetical protein
MANSMKSENKLDGASNLRAWKTRIDLVLAKNKVLDIVKGKIMKQEFEELIPSHSNDRITTVSLLLYLNVQYYTSVGQIGYCYSGILNASMHAIT